MRKNFELVKGDTLAFAVEIGFDEDPVDELLFSMSSLGENQRLLTEKPLRVLADMIGQENCVVIGRWQLHLP